MLNKFKKDIMIKSLNDLETIDKEAILGSGAYSEVIKVRSKIDGQIYALKKINLDKLSKTDFNCLQEEISLHKCLDHPNIIKFH